MGASIAITVTSTGHTIKADAAIQTAVADGGEDNLALVGTFYNDDYLQLSYCSKNLERKQLGVVVLGLAPDGKTLRGCYSGFSPRRETIVSGTISLSKKK